MAKEPYHQLVSGAWERVTRRGHKNQCCDCGLVHRFDYRITADGKIEFRATTDRRATAAVRRAFRFDRERRDE